MNRGSKDQPSTSPKTSDAKKEIDRLFRNLLTQKWPMAPDLSETTDTTPQEALVRDLDQKGKRR
jgi:hypothetical protein